MKKFKVGETYKTRSICDHNCIFEYTVIARTAKRLTLRDKFGDVSKRGIFEYEGVENCKPEGTYSMCPVIDATDNK